MTTEEYAYHLDMGGPYRDAYNAALDARAQASTRRWTDRAAEVAAVAARQSAAASARHKPPLSPLPPQPGQLLSAAAASSCSAAVSMERIAKQAEQPTPPPRPSLKESQAAHWERLVEMADGRHGPRMPPVAPFARQVRATEGHHRRTSGMQRGCCRLGR
jgi:hypothetical protein